MKGIRVSPSSRDWVGLYKEKWKDTGDYITYLWAPKPPKDELFPFLRSVLFQAKYLTVITILKTYFINVEKSFKFIKL